MNLKIIKQIIRLIFMIVGIMIKRAICQKFEYNCIHSILKFVPLQKKANAK